MVFEMEYEIVPAEEQETVPRDLRERHGTTTTCTNLGALMTTILPLAAFMMAALLMLRVLNVRKFSSHVIGLECVQRKMRMNPSTRMIKHKVLHVVESWFRFTQDSMDLKPSELAKRSNVPFKDVDGNPKDPFKIFKDHGYTYSRLRRVMVGPSG